MSADHEEAKVIALRAKELIDIDLQADEYNKWLVETSEGMINLQRLTSNTFSMFAKENMYPSTSLKGYVEMNGVLSHTIKNNGIFSADLADTANKIVIIIRRMRRANKARIACAQRRQDIATAKASEELAAY